MASNNCWKCLLRPSVTSNAIGNASSRLPLLAPFSTSSALGLPPPKKPATGLKKGPEKAAKTLRIKKKAFVKTGRPPAPGERKAMRKRIVLSNTNALEVETMQDLDATLIHDAANIGKVMGLPGTVVDQLRAVEAFKTTQGWGMFRRPGMLIREETVQIADAMKAAQVQKNTAVTIIDGERGTGKSMMLLQAMTTAFLKSWIVVNIPEAQDLSTAMTEYAPIAGTPLYSQPVYAAAWLGQIGKANAEILSQLTVTKRHDLPIPLPENTTLGRLTELGARDSEIAWPIFEAFWSEITSAGRPPILLTIDGLSHVMKESTYRSPEFELIHTHDLAIINLFVQHLSGSKKLPNGGAVFAATSKGNAPLSYATSIAIKQQVERQRGEEITKADPFKIIDERAFKSLQKAKVLELNGLSKTEARGLMEYWAASGVLRSRIDEQTVAEKWALAGHGVVGEIERTVLRMRI